MKELIKKIGPCKLVPRSRGFHGIAQAIIYQQLSKAAASTIMSRVLKIAKGTELTEKVVSRLTDESLREAGVSTRKISYLRDLCERVRKKELCFEALGQLDDGAIVEKLTSVKGIGVWTAEMYLIFDLCRPDVMPLADVSIQKAVGELYGIGRGSFEKRIDKISSQWRPYRSVACWYLWAYCNDPSLSKSGKKGK